jgi:hypothetical protein
MKASLRMLVEIRRQDHHPMQIIPDPVEGKLKIQFFCVSYLDGFSDVAISGNTGW